MVALRGRPVTAVQGPMAHRILAVAAVVARAIRRRAMQAVHPVELAVRLVVEPGVVRQAVQGSVVLVATVQPGTAAAEGVPQDLW